VEDLGSVRRCRKFYVSKHRWEGRVNCRLEGRGHLLTQMFHIGSKKANPPTVGKPNKPKKDSWEKRVNPRMKRLRAARRKKGPILERRKVFYD